MSGQASRSHALRFVRWREQAARVVDARATSCSLAERFELAIGALDSSPTFTAEGLTAVSVAMSDALSQSQAFDVRRAREWAEAELRACDEADQHRAVLEDWTRDKGLGPENREPGAFVGDVCPACEGRGGWEDGDVDGATGWFDKCGACEGTGEPQPGGWPGPLAREFASAVVACPACVDGLAMELVDPDPVDRDCYSTKTRLVRCPKCSEERRRYTSATNAAGRRRVAQRLLDTLDGRCPWAPSAERQPSECKVKFCHFGLDVRRHLAPCSDCSGTGHNIRGYLPEIEWPASTRRKAADSARSMQTADRPTSYRWDLEPAYEAGRESGWTLRRPHATDEPDDPEIDPRTRVTTRGTHRDKTLLGGGGLYPHARYTDQQARSLLPRWRRGELRHAEQRRERTRRRERAALGTPGTPSAIEASMRAAAPSVDRVEVGRASEADPYVVEISFHANTAEDARAAIRAAEEQRSAGMIYRYNATICAALSPIEMSIDFEIR